MKAVSAKAEPKVISVVSAVFILAIQTGFSIQQNTFPSGCICPGNNLTFECIIEGGGMTVWSGSFITDCAGNTEISFPHNNQFAQPPRHGTCNNGAIIAIPLSAENDTYTSQLHINMTMISLSNGSTVTCSYDKDDDVTVIRTWTMIDPPMNLHLEQKNGTHLEFSWDPVSPSCPPFRYNIRTTNCGSCPDSTDSAHVFCDISEISADPETQVCSIAVQSRCDEKIGNMSNILQVLGAHNDTIFVNLKEPEGTYNTATVIVLPVGAVTVISLLVLVLTIVWYRYCMVENTLHIGIKFYVNHEPGSLLQAFQVFKDLNINITCIDTIDPPQPGSNDKLKGFTIWYKSADKKSRLVFERLQSIGARYVQPIEEQKYPKCLDFSVKDSKGALYQVLTVLRNHSININNLKGGDASRPDPIDIRSFTIKCELSDSTAKKLERELIKCGAIGPKIENDVPKPQLIESSAQCASAKFRVQNTTGPGSFLDVMKALQTIFRDRRGKITSFRMSTDGEGQNLVDDIFLVCVYPQSEKNTLEQEISQKFGTNIIFDPIAIGDHYRIFNTAAPNEVSIPIPDNESNDS